MPVQYLLVIPQAYTGTVPVALNNLLVALNDSSPVSGLL